MVAKFLDLKRGPANMAEKTKKNDTYDFPVDDCTHEQNGNPNCSYIVRQRKWLSVLRKNVEIQKFCYHGNVTSHFSSLFCCESCDAIFPPKQLISKNMKNMRFHKQRFP